MPFEEKGGEGDEDKAEEDEDEDEDEDSSSQRSGGTIVPEGTTSKATTRFRKAREAAGSRESKAREAKDKQLREAAGSRKEAAGKAVEEHESVTKKDKKTVPLTGKSST